MIDLARYLMALSLCLMLTGCIGLTKDQPADVDDTQDAPLVTAEPSYTPKEGLQPNTRFLYAVQLLEQGKPAQARIELELLLAQRSRHDRARNLIEQIDTAARDYFPHAYFEITLASGETLSTLSRQYLGDLFQFYALAKYNQIETPSKIQSGQIIRIPLTANASKAREAAAINAPLSSTQQNAAEPPFAAASPATEHVSVEEELLPTNRLDTAAAAEVETTDQTRLQEQKEQQPQIEEHKDELGQANKLEQESTDVQLEPSVEAPEADSEAIVDDAPPPDFQSQMIAALDRKDYGAAADNLENLRNQRGLTPELEIKAIDIYKQGAIAVEGALPQLAARRYFESAKLQIKNGQSEAALPSLKRSLKLDPNNPTATELYTILKGKFAEDYHRQAAKAYRQQDLDRAIGLWNRVLDIDPNHDSARVYLDRAIELKNKLRKFKSE